MRLLCTRLGLLDPLGLPGNSIRTAKYTLLTFLPVNLFQQFTRVANMYFLFIAFLQLIPGLSPTSWVTTVGPLCFVLFINAIKVSRVHAACCSSSMYCVQSHGAITLGHSCSVFCVQSHGAITLGHSMCHHQSAATLMTVQNRASLVRTLHSVASS